jgi:signal transduction histidine kinase
LGARHLRVQSDEAAALRSKVLSLALAERLRATADVDRAAVVERAARRSGAEVLLVGLDGTVMVDGSLEPPSQDEISRLLVEGEGQTLTRLGRTRYFAAPLGPPLRQLSVVTFVPAPHTPYAVRTLANSVAMLTALLVGAAALAAFALARAVHADVSYMRQRVAEMASAEAKPTGEPIPVRAVDQTGILTLAFNRLVQRFTRAEQAYQRDLSRALAYDRDRSEFLAALSHELRTPLNAILGFAEVLLSEVDGPLSAESRENLTVIRSSGEHLRSLIDDILDLSAIESGELRLSCEKISVYAIAANVVREAKVTAQSRPLAVQVTGEPVTAWADARRVRQILSNVVGNAVKFTERGSVLVHVSAPRPEVVLITVTDTGPGIAPEDQAAIFDEYRQTGEFQARQAGTGLGLAISRRLVGMHNGAIWVESSLGEGSRFSIALPTEPGLVVEHASGQQTRISRVPEPSRESAG